MWVVNIGPRRNREHILIWGLFIPLGYTGGIRLLYIPIDDDDDSIQTKQKFIFVRDIVLLNCLSHVSLFLNQLVGEQNCKFCELICSDVRFYPE